MERWSPLELVSLHVFEIPDTLVRRLLRRRLPSRAVNLLRSRNQGTLVPFATEIKSALRLLTLSGT